jgi:hypothetical protein
MEYIHAVLIVLELIKVTLELIDLKAIQRIKRWIKKQLRKK